MQFSEILMVAAQQAAGGPALSLDFTTGSLPGGVTFTRASSGTYFDSAGVMQTASTDVARFDYGGPTPAASPSVLIEPARTNIALYSRDLSNATWTAFGTATKGTDDAAVAPDGTTTADTINFTAGAGQMYQSVSFDPAAYTVGAWVKRAGGSDQTFRLKGQTGVGVDSYSGDFTATSTWQRFTYAFTAGSGFTGSTSYANGSGAASSDILVWEFKVEAGSVATSDITTTSGTVTRAADALSFTVPAGVGTLRYTFDDDSTQDVSVSPGAYNVPTNLNRPRIKTIVGSA